MGAIALLSCARDGQPTGGLKDIQPPEVLESFPPNYSLNFEGNSFAVTFDEYVEIKDFNSQIIVSPTLKNKPTFALKRKTLIVSWTDTLKANTTYQFNFGKAIQDLNEGNIAGNMRFVFSTGDFLDSLHISGRIIDAIDGTPTTGSGVMLYANDVDSLPYTSLPDYFAFSDSSGVFQLDFLPPGDFKLFTLAEKNNNYQYNGPPERIAFADSTIRSISSDSLNAITLRSFLESDTIQYVVNKVQRDFGFHLIVFNVPARNAEILFIDPVSKEPYPSKNYISARGDSLLSWVELGIDSEVEDITVLLSDGLQFRDTLDWRIEIDKRFREKAKLQVRSNTVAGRMPLGRDFTLKFSNPLSEVDSSLVYFYKDSVRIFPQSFSRRDLDREIVVNAPLSSGANYEFKAKPGAFRDIFGSYSDSLVIRFTLQDNEYYGAVNLVLTDSSQTGIDRVLEIRDGKGAIVIREVFQGNFSYNYKRLEPGKYEMRIVYDADQSGIWTTGRYAVKLQPETIANYAGGFEVRSNWVLDVEWNR